MNLPRWSLAVALPDHLLRALPKANLYVVDPLEPDYDAQDVQSRANVALMKRWLRATALVMSPVDSGPWRDMLLASARLPGTAVATATEKDTASTLASKATSMAEKGQPWGAPQAPSPARRQAVGWPSRNSCRRSWP